jgi:hypothetical protein
MTDYGELLRSALSERVGFVDREPLYVIALEAKDLSEQLPDSASLGTELESVSKWQPLYLALDVTLFRAATLMNMPVFLVDNALRESERLRILHELDALGMFA